jgi:hypothetical protein
MKLGSAINGLLQLALVGGCIYVAVNLGFGGSSDDPAAEHAQSACTTAIRHRFDGGSARVYAVEPNSRGYVVRASVTVRGDTPAKIYCLANEHGGVEELRILEH